jgi:cytochrome c2
VQPGNELKSKVEFDYTQGLLKQIYNYNWDFQEYCEYINEPKQLLNPIRDIIFFDNWILE